MKTSDKLIEAFEKFRPHINGHRTSIDLFLEALKEVEVMEQELSKLHQPAVMSWVACSERLPDSIGSYLCFWENCYVGMLYFNSNKEWFEVWEQEKHKPTHWMPLPKPPCT